jgi:hypothetical protein
MTSKLSICNDALAGTANGLIDQAGLDALDPDAPITDQNSAYFVEDRVSRAYDRELPLLLERHPWNFARATEALEAAGADENPSNRYGSVYYWPVLALWLETVEAPGGTPIPYEIIGRYICMDYDTTGASDAPVATFIQMPPTSDVSNLFWEILRRKVEIGILRAINEDYTEAKRREDDVESTVIPLVRTRTDQQQPSRIRFVSTMRERRRSGGGPQAL